MATTLGLGLALDKSGAPITPGAPPPPPPPPPPVETYYLVIQTGDTLVTHAGDRLVWQ